MNKFLFLGVFALFLPFFAVQAQETATTTTTAVVDASSAVVQDQTITASDLGVAEPTVLPDSGLYFFKDWGRGVKMFFTFNQVKKAELNMQYSNERLLEAKKLAEKTKDSAKVAKAMEKYEAEKTKIQTRIETLKTDPSKAEQVNALLDKLSEKEIKHQKLLDKLQSEMPENIKAELEKSKERALSIFADTLSSSDTPEKMKERMEKAMEAQKGSKFKNFKNLEILKRIEEKVPEQAREAIKQAQENALKRLNGDISNMSPEDQARFSDYIEKISTSTTTRSDMLDKMMNSASEQEKEHIKNIRERQMEKMKEMMEKEKKRMEMKNEREKMMPEESTSTPAGMLRKVPENMREPGTITREELKEKLNVQNEPKEPVNEVVCTQQFEPVCGANGKTYPNECVAVKQNGVRVLHKGECGPALPIRY
ncbi:hypothetical protein HY249_00390 [Candidatus Azambacteria bacterium]|nr:hypothetical protein [Candidatus Azambacteria bacterium]